MRPDGGLGRRGFIGLGLAAAAGSVPVLAAPSLFAELEARTGGKLGVYGEDLASGRQLTHRADERFPLCSSFKCLAAGAVLARVDLGEARLDQRVAYGPSDLLSYAPVAKAHVGEGGLSLGALCEAAVTLSDNTAANLILARIGGPAGLTGWLRKLGDPVTRLDRTEPELNHTTPGDPRDTTSPRAMARTVRKLLLGEVLKPASRQQLLAWMDGCQTGDARIRAGAPGWRVADKTGTAGGSRNDVAYLRHPSGRQIMLALYLKEAVKLDDAGRDAVLADATRLVLDVLGAARHG